MEKPNYRILVNAPKSEESEILAIIHLRRKTKTLEEKTFSLSHSDPDSSQRLECCCLCVIDNIIEPDISTTDHVHKTDGSTYRVYANGYEIPISHCKICNLQIPTNEELISLENKYNSMPPGEFSGLLENREVSSERKVIDVCICDYDSTGKNP